MQQIIQRPRRIHMIIVSLPGAAVVPQRATCTGGCSPAGHRWDGAPTRGQGGWVGVALSQLLPAWQLTQESHGEGVREAVASRTAVALGGRELHIRTGRTRMP